MFNRFFSFLILFSPMLTGSKFPILAMIGKINIYFYSILIIIFFMVDYSKDNRLKLDFIFGTFLLLAFYMIMRSHNFEGIALAMQFSVVGIIFVIYRDKVLPFIEYNPYLWLFVVSVFSLFEFLFPGSFFANTNYWSLMIVIYFLPSIFVCNNKFFKILLTVVTIFLVVISGSRSVLLSIVISYFLVFGFLAKDFGLGKIFKSLVILALVILLLTVGGDIVDFLSGFDGYLLEHTGKRFESGRFDIWMGLLNSLTPAEWLLGKGGGISAGSVLGTKLSAHSTYVYILFTYGLVGLFLLCVLLFSCIRKLLALNMYMSVFFVVCLLVRDVFEVSLINNSFSISMFFWGLYMTSSLERNLATYK